MMSQHQRQPLELRRSGSWWPIAIRTQLIGTVRVHSSQFQNCRSKSESATARERAAESTREELIEAVRERAVPADVLEQLFVVGELQRHAVARHA
jgi:peptide subunit release factor RF-3